MEVVNRRNITTNAETDYYIGRGTILGNPFTVRKFGRPFCLQFYKIHFDYMVQHSTEFLNAVKEASGYKRLVCYCKPSDCHGDYILKYIQDVLEIHFYDKQ